MGSKRMNKAQRKAVHEGLKKFLSVLLSLAMVLQTSPVAYARWDEGVNVVPQEETVPTEEQVEEVVPEEEIPEAPAEEPAPVVEAEPMAEPMAEPEPEPAPEVQEQPVAVPAIASVAIENLTTDSVLASSTQDNHLKFKVAYEGLEAGASYKLVLEPMDRRTPEAAQAQQVLLGEPYYIEETDEWRQDPFTWTSDFAPAAATGEQEIELKKVDLHWVAGAAYALRATLYNANGEPVVQRVFDGEYDAKLYVPGIAATLHAADGTAEVEAADGAELVDSVAISGLPRNADINVIGALYAQGEDDAIIAIASGATTFHTGDDGRAEDVIAYPSFDASALAGHTLLSELSISVPTEHGDVLTARFPSSDGFARKDEPARTSVAVQAVEQQEEEQPKEEEPAEAEDEGGVSVAHSDTGTVAVSARGRAATDPAFRMVSLLNEVTVPEALSINSALSQINPATGLYDRSGEPSSSPAIDAMAEGLTIADKEGDGSNIEDLQVKWVTNDAYEDGDKSMLSLRPDSVDARSDANQTVTAQVDYSLSGERGFRKGDIRIYVPATLFTKRDGSPAGDVVIPYAKAPSTATEFNWELVGDYYVFTNTMPITNAATKGYLQIQWVNLTPHEIRDAFANNYTDPYKTNSHDNDDDLSAVDPEAVTKPWYAYIEVSTFADNTLRMASNEVRANMDTGQVVDSAYKRVTTGYPQVVKAGELPEGTIPEAYKDEQSFVIVDWYMYAHRRGNQPYTLDVEDTLVAAKDGAYEGGNLTAELEKPGFVCKVVSSQGEAVYSEKRDSVTVAGSYSGWPQREMSDTPYVHVYSAYPASQFAPSTEYIFHNQVDYTLNPVDGVDTPTKAKATAAISYSWEPSEWKDVTGHFMVFKWGNDGEEALENYQDFDMVSHNPSWPVRTISRTGDGQQHYSTWYGIYDGAINKIRDFKEGDEPVRLWYTIKSEGWVLPWTLQRPDPAHGVQPDAQIENGWWQWAKWDEGKKQYVVAENPKAEWTQYATYNKEANVYVTDTTKTEGYELIPYTRIESNYLKRPVTMITTDQGLHLEGTSSTDDVTMNQSISGGVELTPGSDYVFDYVEVEKPEIGKIKAINVNMDGSFNVQNNQDGTFDYATDLNVANIPPIVFDIEVDGAWQEGFATVDWSSGSPRITYANGSTESSAVVKMPEGTTNFRTVATTTKNAYLMEWLYPGVSLLPSGEAKLSEFMAGKFTDSEGNKVYQPQSRVWNGVHMDAYQYDNAGTTMDPAPIFSRTKWGDDRINGYTTDVSVYPSKSAEFNHVKDVNYETRQVTVHYTAKVEERTHVTDRETYLKALEDGIIVEETSGTWWDLLPEGMVPILSSIKVRRGDTITNVEYDQGQDWNGTGRHMLRVDVDLTPSPREYKENDSSSTSYWMDAPTISFDATMDLDTWIDLGGDPAQAETGIASHNVVAFESGNKRSEMDTTADYSWEGDGIDKANAQNVATRTGKFSDDEIKAFDGLDPDAEDPAFVYAQCTTKLAFPTAGRTSLSKSIDVNDENRWSQGTYDDARYVMEGGFYTYRLRMASDANTKSKNLVMYDTLENYYAVDGNDDVDINAPRWRGELISVDTSQMRSAGCEPVVYYSTEEDLSLTDPDNARRSNAENIDITNGDIWVLASEYKGSLKDVHAVAIDCTKTPTGEDFVLDAGKSLTAYIRMHAPWGTQQWDDYAKIAEMYPEDGGSARSYIAADAHAYNNVYLVSTSVQADADFVDGATVDFIRHDYTKVGLKEYQIPVTKEWDDDDDRDGLRPEKITVTLYANNKPATADVTASNTLELTKEGDWKGTFRNLPYSDSKGKMINYRVVETDVQVPDGYTGQVSGNAINGFTVTNTHTPELTSVSGTKTWRGDDPTVRPAYIDLTLLADGEPSAAKRIEPDENGNWPAYTFENLLKYHNHGTEIVYTVEEVVPDAAYVSAVEGNDLVNTYHPYGDVSITKWVKGATEAAADKTFEFGVTLETALGGGEWEPLAGTYDYDVVSEADPENILRSDTVSSGGTISLQDGETAVIHELPHRTRVTFSEGEYPGFAASNGGVATTVVQENRGRATSITNTYRATGTASLTATKALEGAKLKDNKFAFELVDDATGDVVATASNRADGSVTFGTLSYRNANAGHTYTYTIREQVPDGATNAEGVTWKDATEEQRAAGGFTYLGYTYDSTTYTATVTVKDNNGEGKLDVTVVYTDADGNEVEQPEFRKFSNAYEAHGDTSLRAWKAIDDAGLGRKPEEGEFTFELVPVSGIEADGKTAIAADDVPMPLDDADARQATVTVANDAEGIVDFPPIPFDQSDNGRTYFYVAHEIPGEDGTVIYTEDAFGYRVTVKDAGNGTITASQAFVEVTKGEDGSWELGEVTDSLPVFVNRLKPGSLTLTKLVQGETANPDQEFTFRVTLWGENVDPDASYEYDVEQVPADPVVNEGVNAAGKAADIAQEIAGTALNVTDAGEPAQVVPTGNVVSQFAMPLHSIANLFAPTMAYADIRGWSNYTAFGSSFKWRITDDGTLEISPIEGDEGVFKFCNDNGSSQTPWYNNGTYKYIKHFKVVGGTIHAQGKLYRMFNGCPLEDVDFTNFDTSAVTGMDFMFASCPNLDNPDLSGLDTSNVVSMDSMFGACPNLKTIDVSGFDTSNVTSMRGMFSGTVGGAGFESIDLSSWDTSKVTNMNDMFGNCVNLKTLNLKGLNLSSVTDMGDMFDGCKALETVDLSDADLSSLKSLYSFVNGCTNLKTVDLSGADLSSLTRMESMFYNCQSLESVDLSDIDTSKVTSMRSMFSGCPSLTSVDVSGFDTSSVTDMSYMFSNCTSLTSLDLSDWDVSQVTTISNMFRECTSLESVDMTGWNLQNVTSLYDTFENCTALKTLDLSGWDLPKLTDMAGTFNGCTSLESLDLSGWNVPALNNLGSTFSGCSSLKSLDMSNWNSPSLNSLYNTFYGCSSLEELDVSGLDTSNVKRMYATFGSCKSLRTLDLSDWDTSSATDMSSMFSNCSSLESIDVSGFDTSSVTNMNSMFYGCSSLDAIDVSGFDTSKVTNMGSMFSSCSSLDAIDVSGFDMSSATSVSYMFAWCPALETLDLSAWRTPNVTTMSGMFSGDTALTSVDISGFDTSKVTYMSSMFSGDNSLVEVTLGGNYRFKGKNNSLSESSSALLPQPPLTTTTGKWIRVNDNGDTYGTSYTPKALRDAYNAGLAGTWVWENGSHVIHFDRNGGEGMMSDLVVTETPFELPANTFTPGNELVEFGGWAADSEAETKWFDDGAEALIQASREDEAIHELRNGIGWVSTGHAMTQDGTLYEITLYAKWDYTKYGIEYDKGDDNAGGTMDDVAVAPTEPYEIPESSFYWFDHEVTGWDVTVVDKNDEDVTEARGKTHYEAGETIAAGDFEAGDRVTLKAVWQKIEHSASSSDGQFEVTLHAGEMAVFEDNIPAGTSYTIEELTPDGWVLVESSGEEGTVMPAEVSAASFTNREKQTFETEMPLVAKKQIHHITADGTEETKTPAAGAFSFQLFDSAGELVQTATNDADGNVTFDAVGFNEAGSYDFTIREKVPDGAEEQDDGTFLYNGIAYDGTSHTATIVVTGVEGDDGNTTLVAADPVYDSESTDAPVFTNTTVEERPTTYALNIQKVAEGATEDDTFTFVVSLTDKLGQKLPEGTAYTLDGQESALDGSSQLTLTIAGEGAAELAGLPEGTRFTVTETDLPEGWALSTSDGASGTLNADATATFTNEYTATGQVVLRARKVMSGGEMSEGQFSFGLYATATDAEADQNRLQTQVNGPATATADGTMVAEVTFQPIILSKADAGVDHVYFIREIPGDDGTIEYSDQVVEATFTVTDDHRGTLTASDPQYTPEDAALNNAKKPGELKITKSLQNAGANVKDTEFAVTLTLNDANGAKLDGEYAWTSDRAGVEGGVVASGGSLVIHGDETITVSGIPDGTSYVVEEDEDAAYAVGFTLTASDGLEGTVTSGGTSEAALTNTYLTGATAKIEATKVLEGGTLEKGQFGFELVSNGEVVATATNAADGSVTFPELSYGLNELGEHVYQIREAVAQDAPDHIKYDLNVYTATVTVTRGMDGDLVATVAYADGDGEAVDEVTFTNKYTAVGKWHPEVFKTLDGAEPEEGQFTFELQRNGSTLQTKKNDANGNVIFDDITFTEADAGKTYAYSVREVDDNQAGIVYDVHACRFDVKITDNGDGTLKVEGTPYGTGRDQFKNTSNEPAQGEIKVEKVLDGLDWSDETQFTFTLTADKGNPDTTAMPETKSLTIDKNTASHAKSFGTFKINKAGSYRYYVQETKGDIRGLEYDTTRHAVDINVIEDGDGNLVAAQGSSLVQTETITNTYTAVTDHLEVTKEFTGRGWKASDAFTFSLEAVTEGAPMPDEDGRTATATTRQKTAAFGDIEFFEAGTYEYKITENPGQLGGVTYNADNHSAIITVDKAEGSSKLEVKSITYDGKKTDAVTITNTYEAEGSVKLSATKTVTGDGWPEGAEFTFELRDADGNVKDTKTATKGEGATVTFDEIKYENFKQGGQTEYTYTINEVVPGTATNADGIAYSAATDEQKAAGGFMQDGITYSTKVVEVKVTLSDNTDGTLSTAVTADNRVITAGDDGTFMVGEFENVAFSRTATVELNKLLYGEDGAVTFRMTPAGATAAQKAKPAEDGTYVYSPTQFVEWTADVKPGEVTKVTSPAIKFYKRGTYEFVIEEPNAPEGYDEATILATVTISDAQDATVSYQISKYDGAEYEDVDGLVTLYNNEMVAMGFRGAAMRRFNNRYLVTAFQPEVRKVLENGALKAGEFTFELRDAGGNLISTATNDENGLVRFDAIRYERSAAANARPEMVVQADGTETFTYTITEKAGNEAAIVYSSESIGLTVTVSVQDGDLVATGKYSQASEAGKAPEPTEVPTITNHYDTVKIHAVKYSREDLEQGIKTPLAHAWYDLWMANPDGADVLIGTQESDAEGNLWYDIPSIEGVAYYLKESAEHEPPAGHLVDPYPTDYFTLIVTEDGSFDLVYEYEFGNQEEFMSYVASRAQA